MKAYLYGSDIKNDNLINHEQRESIRLNKYISSSQYCSRREADKLIEEGKVYIDGIKAEKGTQVYNTQEVRVNDYVIKPQEDLVYLILNKPKGITCTTDLKDKDNIIDYLDYTQRVFPIGRLDKDSTGLIILTNDGDIVNKVLRSKYEHEKEYIVTVDKDIDNHFLNKMKSGVTILNNVTKKYQRTKPCSIKKISTNKFRIIITEGLNRQIRRMCKELDYKVIALERIRFMNINLDDLPINAYRYISNDELAKLNVLINKNTN